MHNILLFISLNTKHLIISPYFKLNKEHANQEALVIKMMMTMTIMTEHTLVNSTHKGSGLINQILSYPIWDQVKLHQKKKSSTPMKIPTTDRKIIPQGLVTILIWYNVLKIHTMANLQHRNEEILPMAQCQRKTQIHIVNGQRA